MKFKEKYVLAIGYPVTQDVTKKIKTIQMVARPDHIGEEDAITLKIPEYLVSAKKMPKYRLTLEKVKEAI